MASKQSSNSEKDADDLVQREQIPTFYDGRSQTLRRLRLLLSVDVRKTVQRQMTRKGPVVCGGVDRQGRALLLTDDADVAQAVLDERLFTKEVTPQLALLWEVKSVLGDGLLTASTDDMVWKQARKIMTPVFARQGVQLHFQAMCSTARAACQTLDRHTAEAKHVELLPFAVRATLHAILQALFSHTSDLYENESLDHQLSIASQAVLEQSVVRVYYPRFVKRLRCGDGGWTKASDMFAQRLGEFIRDRQRQRRRKGDAATNKQDILQCMLDASDGDDDDDNAHLIQQLTLLIIAGHETTGSSIAYLLYTLAHQPADLQERIALEAEQAGLASVVVGDADVSVSSLSRLPFTDSVIHESLRLNPPATTLLRIARHDQIVTASNGKRYEVRKGDIGSVLLSPLHRNRYAWGEDAHLFRPQRFDKTDDGDDDDDAAPQRHPYAYLPFAAGARNCLGRAFAMQELRLFSAVFALKFHLGRRRTMWMSLPMRDYYGFTMKPKNAWVRVHRRVGNKQDGAVERTYKEKEKQVELDSTAPNGSPESTSAPPPCLHVQVAYGSNHGQCRGMAYELHGALLALGLAMAADEPCALDALISDDEADKDKSHLVFTVTSTYNGEPPDNAARFYRALESPSDNSLVRTLRHHHYAVFGAGNAEWRATLHAFPRWIDGRLEQLGARRFFRLGTGDADDDLHGDWRSWMTALLKYTASTFHVQTQVCDDVLQSISDGTFAGANGAEIRVQWWGRSKSTTTQELHDDSKIYTIVEKDELQQVSQSTRSTLAITLDLGSRDCAHLYDPGDHLELWPQTSKEQVASMAAKLCLDNDDLFSIRPSKPINPTLAAYRLSLLSDCTVGHALTHYIDVQSPLRKTLVMAVGQLLQAKRHFHRADIIAAVVDQEQAWHSFTDKVPTVYAFLLFVCGDNDDDSMPPVLLWQDWLTVLPAPCARTYSIASYSPNTARILVSVQPEGQIGRMLTDSEVGDTVVGRIQRCQAFRLASSLSTPSSASPSSIIMIAAGTGLAPFLSFLDYLSQLSSSTDKGSSPPRSTLVYGCRAPYDLLCDEQLRAYRDGNGQCRRVLDHMIVAYSRQTVNDIPPCYVGDAIRSNGRAIAEQLCEQNTYVYICGAASTMAQNALQALQDGELIPCVRFLWSKVQAS